MVKIILLALALALPTVFAKPMIGGDKCEKLSCRKGLCEIKDKETGCMKCGMCPVDPCKKQECLGGQECDSSSGSAKCVTVTCDGPEPCSESWQMCSASKKTCKSDPCPQFVCQDKCNTMKCGNGFECHHGACVAVTCDASGACSGKAPVCVGKKVTACKKDGSPCPQFVCAAATTCSATEYETKALTTSSDRECAELTECTSTQFESVKATETSDRQCKQEEQEDKCARTKCLGGQECKDGVCHTVTCKGPKPCSEAWQMCTASKKQCFTNPCPQFVCQDKCNTMKCGNGFECHHGECVAVTCAASSACSGKAPVCVDKKVTACKKDGSPCPQYECVKEEQNPCDDVQLPPCARPKEGCRWTMKPLDENGCTHTCGEMVCEEPVDKCANVKCQQGTQCYNGACTTVSCEGPKPCPDAHKVDCIDNVEVCAGWKALTPCPAFECKMKEQEPYCKGSQLKKGESGKGTGTNWCNGCSCMENGMLRCTTMACGPNPDEPCAGIKLPMCAFPKKGCRWTMEPKDENGCTNTCGEMVCEPTDPCEGRPIPGCMRPRPGCSYPKPTVDQDGCPSGCGKMVCDIDGDGDECKEVGATKPGEGDQHCATCTCIGPARRDARMMAYSPDDDNFNNNNNNRNRWDCPREKYCPPKGSDTCVVGATKQGDGNNWCNTCQCVEAGGRRHARMPPPQDFDEFNGNPKLPDTTWMCTKIGCIGTQPTTAPPVDTDADCCSAESKPSDLQCGRSGCHCCGAEPATDADCCSAESKPSAMECGRSGCHCCGAKPARRHARMPMAPDDKWAEGGKGEWKEKGDGKAQPDTHWITGNSGPNMTPEQACARANLVPADTCSVRRHARKMAPPQGYGGYDDNSNDNSGTQWITGNSGPNMTPEQACARANLVPADTCATKCVEGESGPGVGSNWCNTCTCKDGAMTMCTKKGCGDKPDLDCSKSVPGKGTNWCNTCQNPECNEFPLCTMMACGPNPISQTPAPATADIIATTELVEAVVAGATTLAVRDVTGIRAGDFMTIGSGAGKERATVAAVKVSVTRARREVQAGNVTLTEALQNNHAEGSSITFERTNSESAKLAELKAALLLAQTTLAATQAELAAAIAAGATGAELAAVQEKVNKAAEVVASASTAVASVDATAVAAAAAAAAAAEAAAAAAKTQTAIVAVVVVLIVVVIIVGAIVYKRNAQNNQSPIVNALAAARTTTNAMQNPQYEVTPGANAGDATYDNVETGC